MAEFLNSQAAKAEEDQAQLIASLRAQIQALSNLLSKYALQVASLEVQIEMMKNDDNA